MRTIKFIITYQHEDTGRITRRSIELGQPIPHLGERWNIIGKDQFTDIHDKNGNEIYEGDILKWCENDEQFNKDEYWQKYIVKIPNFYYSLESNADVDIEDIKIIGNIYENSELLK
jgi:hypothetical protein